MEFIIDYWYIVIAFACIGGIVGAYIYKVFQAPTDEQIDKVREWLVLAVSLAEQKLGSGTGKLKLRYTYDMFLTKFPWLASVVSFETFSGLVDSALKEMRGMLSNTKMQEFIGVDNSEVQRLQGNQVE